MQNFGENKMNHPDPYPILIFNSLFYKQLDLQNLYLDLNVETVLFATTAI